MFNSPTEWCPVIKDWVAADEGVAECARLHHCSGAGLCPLERAVAGTPAGVSFPGGVPPVADTEPATGASDPSEGRSGSLGAWPPEPRARGASV